MNGKEHKIAKLKIKSLRYTLMELREINYLKRNGKPIPPSLKFKRCDDFEICETSPKKHPIIVFPGKEIIDEKSELHSSSNFDKIKKVTFTSPGRKKEISKSNLFKSDEFSSEIKNSIKSEKKIDITNSNKNTKTIEDDNIINLIRSTINNQGSSSDNMAKINESKEINSLTEKNESKFESQMKNNENDEISKSNAEIVKLRLMKTPNYISSSNILNSNISKNSSISNSEINSSNSKNSSEDIKEESINDKSSKNKSESSDIISSDNVSIAKNDVKKLNQFQKKVGSGKDS